MERESIFDPNLCLNVPLHNRDGGSIQSQDAFGHPLSITGALWRPQGRRFDGVDDKMIVPGHAALNSLTNITVIAWVKMTASPSLFVSLAMKNRPADPWYDYGLGLVPTPPRFRMIVNVGGVTRTCTAAAAASPDVFYHLAGTFNGASINLFVNAVAEAPFVYAGAMSVGTGSFSIGAYYDGSDAFPGTIGEVRVFNRALLPLEVLRDYMTTKWRYR